jgi:ESAT-6 family protein
MATYGLNPNGMLDTAEELTLITSRLEASLRSLEAAAKAFQAATSGNAIDTYTSAQMNWNAGMNEMRGSLGVATTKLIGIQERYVLADNKGASLFGGMV